MTIPARQPYAGELVFTAFQRLASGRDQEKGLAEREKVPGAHWDVPYLTIDPADNRPSRIPRSHPASIRNPARAAVRLFARKPRVRHRSWPRTCSVSSARSRTMPWTTSAVKVSGAELKAIVLAGIRRARFALAAQGV